MDVSKLIDFHKYPLQTCMYYHGDVTRDTIESLEMLETATAQAAIIPEILGHFPEEDELIDIIETLQDALTMSKADMIEQIKKVLTMLEFKNSQLVEYGEFARSLTE